MGVPGFYRWLVDRYPKVVIDAVEEQPDQIPVDTFKPNPNGEFDNLYIDMNSILHDCFHPDGRTSRTTDEVFKCIFDCIDRIFAMVRPRKLIFMAIDGVAPRAKLNQQRSRRFRAAKDAADAAAEESKLREKFKREGKKLPAKQQLPDSNLLSPGTEFMSLFSTALRHYVHLRLNSDSQWKQISVLLSDANVPGEGEHKIMSYIRGQRGLPGFDPNIRHCLYSLDSDLILLALATHEVHFSILRERQQVKCFSCGQLGHLATNCAEYDVKKEAIIPKKAYHFLNIWTLREYLEYEFIMPNSSVIDFERVVDDFIFMCFFVGNDFLPPLPTFGDSEDAISMLMVVYKEEFPSMGGYLTNSCMLDLDRVEQLTEAVGSHEDKIFQRRARLLKDDKDKAKRAKKGRAKKPRHVDSLASGAVHLPNEQNDAHVQRSIQASSNVVNAENDLDAEERENKEELELMLKDLLLKKSYVFSSENPPEDQVMLGKAGWKDRYYKSRFDALTFEQKDETRRKVIHKYVEGLCWVMRYYYEGVPSWEWFYPYHYAPFASDLTNLSQLKVTFNLGSPFKPLDQLMAVLPVASAHALPINYQLLMTNPKSPIIDFYPTDFEVDTDGKRFYWQGIAKLPFIEEIRLLTAIKQVEHTLTPEEMKRNSTSHSVLFVNSSHSLSHCISSLYHNEVEEKLDPSLSGGMNGSIAVCSGDQSPSVSSPVDGMEDIINNEVICSIYKLPEPHWHRAGLPAGVILPNKGVAAVDLKPLLVPWLEDTPRRAHDSSRLEPHLSVEQHREPGSDSAAKSIAYSHEVLFPEGYASTGGEHVSVNCPHFNGKMAKAYPFELDNFQQISIACLERKECLVVSAHTSAGKTAIAEYAIAMSFRDQHKVIYTAPIKALSNQKYRDFKDEFVDVGLMTGDVTVNPEARCLVMTTEILRARLCTDSNMEGVKWIIFDEVHYIEHRERGLVWEESLIFMPPGINLVFLSATASNASEFAEWICSLNKRPCHAVYTGFRPTPLHHYLFPVGGDKFQFIAGEDGQFAVTNFLKMQRRPEFENPSMPSNVLKVLKMIREREWLPVIIFSFSRSACNNYCKSLDMDLNTEDEKAKIDSMINIYFEERSRDLLSKNLNGIRRGITVQHSGLIPMIREFVELLFLEGLVKVLFATETLSMGVNLPVKTVVFTSIEKWDGLDRRYVRSGEYKQMSGRAGRRGKDSNGISIIMVDKTMKMDVMKEMVLGKPAPLISTFRLSYSTILKLIKTDKRVVAEHVISKSFHLFQYTKASQGIEKRIVELETEATALTKGVPNADVEYYNLLHKISELEKGIIWDIIKPGREYLTLGMVVKVRDNSHDWGWGVLATDIRKPSSSQSMNPALVASRTSRYEVDVWVEPIQPCSEEDGTMTLVTVPISSIYALSRLVMTIPEEISNQLGKVVSWKLQEFKKKYPDGFPESHPITDLKIKDAGFVKRFNKLEDLKQKLYSYTPLESGHQKMISIVREIENLKLKTSDLQLQKFRDELQNRLLVLKKLGHIDSDDVVQLKGQAACWIDSADELLIMEAISNGIFRGLDYYQVASLASCFIPVERTDFTGGTGGQLRNQMEQLKKCAETIAIVQEQCGIELDKKVYVEASSRPDMMSVIDLWSKGKAFDEVMATTSIHPGDVIRHVRRLSGLLQQMGEAASVIKHVEIADKFREASRSIFRGEMSSSSLYVQAVSQLEE